MFPICARHHGMDRRKTAVILLRQMSLQFLKKTYDSLGEETMTVTCKCHKSKYGKQQRVKKSFLEHPAARKEKNSKIRDLLMLKPLVKAPQIRGDGLPSQPQICKRKRRDTRTSNPSSRRNPRIKPGNQRRPPAF
jgi:hypothetical protein